MKLILMEIFTINLYKIFILVRKINEAVVSDPTFLIRQCPFFLCDAYIYLGDLIRCSTVDKFSH